MYETNTSREQLLERPMPHSAEAERAVIGSIILDNTLVSEAAAELEPSEFYVRAHSLIYEAILELSSAGQEINPILLGERLNTRGMLEQVGGIVFISETYYGLPHFSSLASYIKVIKGKAIRRQHIKSSSLALAESFEEDQTEDELLDAAGQRLFALMDMSTRSRGRFTQAGNLIQTNLEKALERQERGQVVTGLTTGYKEVDALTLGLQPTDLIIIAARPSAGKTSLGLCFAQNAGLRHDAVVAIFSLEMSKEQLGDRIACSEARVDAMKLRSGYFNRDEWARLIGTRDAYKNSKIFIDDTPAITPLFLRARARQLAMEQKRLDLILVDYLQLMSGSTKRGAREGSREQEVSSISRELKAVAKELNVPLVALSQLNRASEQRSDHRPLLSDLRESGSIEQDADVVGFIYREEMYEQTDKNAGKAEIIIAKNRNGPTGSAFLTWLKEFTRFENAWEGE